MCATFKSQTVTQKFESTQTLNIPAGGDNSVVMEFPRKKRGSNALPKERLSRREAVFTQAYKSGNLIRIFRGGGYNKPARLSFLSFSLVKVSATYHSRARERQRRRREVRHEGGQRGCAERRGSAVSRYRRRYISRSAHGICIISASSSCACLPLLVPRSLAPLRHSAVCYDTVCFQISENSLRFFLSPTLLS